MSQVKIKLPDGAVREVPRGTTPADIAARISGRLAKEALAARVNGEVVDLSRPITQDASLEILTFADEDAQEVFHHSTAHLMAQAIKRLFPEAKLTIGPPVEEGFYYDIDAPRPFTPEDLEAIEREMARARDEDFPIERAEISRQEALDLFKRLGEPYKIEIIDDLPEGETISIYRQGEFVDLCVGPHVPSTGRLRAFKLTSVAGAYWRGDEKNRQLQRIYGVSFEKQSQLEEYLWRREEAKRRDHRKLGQELELFFFRDEAPGFVFWQPKGYTLYRTLENFSREVQGRRGYQEVSTPWIFRDKFWQISGHWSHYKENMFIIESEGEELAPKPMNCPAHCMLYKADVRSYRDLPWKVSEYGPLSRYERSGTLHGALRVRGMHQDDAHLFIREDQIEDQIREVLEIVDEIYRAFGMPYEIKLSTRPDNYMGELELWNRAEASLARALASVGKSYKLNPGDGAFYGPKLDFDVTDALGRKWQCATVQLDFQLPIKFDLEYVGEDGNRHRPVMIHRAIMGTLERFIGILTEHFAGAFPTWLAPVQAKLIPIADRHVAYAEELARSLGEAGVRVEVDATNDRMGAKVRNAQLQKIPYMLVLGDKEVESRSVAVRHRSVGDLGIRAFDEFRSELLAEIRERRVEAQAFAGVAH